MHHDYLLCGWRVRSDIPLSELHPWSSDDHPVDIDIRLAAIPTNPESPIFVLPHSDLWADGTFLLNMAGIGRFWVTGGREVRVEPVPGCMEGELKAFLLGSVLGVLCHQRGLLPIHASAVSINGAAILITGHSGEGKSTLAAALGARGHTLLTDDIAAIDPTGPWLLPAYPQRKLTPDVLETLDMPQDGLVTHRPGLVKYRVPVTDFDPTPRKPVAIYRLNVLAVGACGAPSRLGAVQSMAALDDLIYRRGVGQHIQPKKHLFAALGRLAQATPVYDLYRRKGAPLHELEHFAQQVEAHALRHLPSAP